MEPPVADDAAGLAGEERPLGVTGDVGGDVVVDGVEHEAGEDHGALTGVGFGCFAPGALVDGLPDGDGGLEPVVMAYPEAAYLAVAESTEAGDEVGRHPGRLDTLKPMSNRRGVRRTTIGLRIVVGTLLVLAANLLLNLASALPSESWLSAHRVWIIGGLVVIVVLGIVVDVAFGLRGDEAGRRSPTTEEVLAALRRAEWRLQVSATEKRSGRLSLVVPQNRVGLHVSLRRLEIARGGERLVESPVPLSCEATELPEVFAEKLNSQLVLIGRPGAGKTVCALQIVDHFNRPDVDEGSPLMVMLNLSGWPVWHAQQIGEGERPTMEQWIADQIVQRHDLVPEEALAAASDPRLVPIFDGLDEVPPDTDDFFGRSTCVQQLNEFIRHRPHFVVCCRAEEYLEMAPRLVGNHSQAIMSIEPLAPENVARYLEMRGHKWTTLVERLRTGTPTEQDAVARSILDRPLYVALALDVFDRTDPVGLPLDSTMSATDHLWRHFLQSRDSSRRAQQPIERWLQTIAHLMHDANSTSFWMHQVTIPTSTVFEVYRTIVFLVAGAVCGLTAYAILSSVAWGLVAALVGSVTFVIAAAKATWITKPPPRSTILQSFASSLRWGTRLLPGALPLAGLWFAMAVTGDSDLTAPVKLGSLLGLLAMVAIPFLSSRGELWFAEALGRVGESLIFAGIVVLLISQLLVARGTDEMGTPVLWLGTGTGVLLVAIVGRALGTASGIANLAAKEEVVIFQRRPMSIIAQSMATGLLIILVGATLTSLLFAVCLATAAHPITWWAVVLVSVLLWFPFGMSRGIGIGLVHAAARVGWSREHLLPWRLVSFLDWCSDEDRRWTVKVGPAYQFRHKDLQDYLLRGIGIDPADVGVSETADAAT